MTDTTEHRTYGGWQRPKSWGLWNLGTLGTGLLFGYMLAAVLVNSVSGLKPTLIWCAIGGVGLLPLVYRDHSGRHGWQVASSHIAWFHRRNIRREHVYLPGKIGPVAFGQQTIPLPGILAKSTVLEADDVYGQPFTLIHLPVAKHYTVPIRIEPDGSALVDQQTVDTWVGYYDRWLAGLAYEPGLVAATVTVETAPDPGHGLTVEVDRLLTSGGPALSKQVLRETADTYPAGAASITAHVSLTYSAANTAGGERELSLRSKDKATRRTRSSGEMAALIGSRLAGQLRDLGMTGVGAPQPMTASELAEMVRVAYDPMTATAVSGCRANDQPADITWQTAGPSGAVESWNTYQHDSGHSITWQMVEAPKGIVEARVLEDLLAPSDAVDRKRVTLIYRPHDPARAADIVDEDMRTAVGRATARKGEARAAETARLEAARQAAREEASGAGVIRFATLVTATVTDETRLAAAADTVAQLGRASRIRLRRCYGTQAAAFQQALGVGVIPTSHVLVPELLRDKT